MQMCEQVDAILFYLTSKCTLKSDLFTEKLVFTEQYIFKDNATMCRLDVKLVFEEFLRKYSNCPVCFTEVHFL